MAEDGGRRLAIDGATKSELGVQVSRLLKSWKYELETRLQTMQGFADGVHSEVKESQAWQDDHVARERARTLELVGEHDRVTGLLAHHFAQVGGQLERELGALRDQLARTVDELRPVMGGTSAIVSGLDNRLAAARVHAQRASDDVDQAAAMAVRAASELQATAHKLLTRLALHDERQRAAETELRAAVRQYVVDETAQQLDALRDEALERVRAASAELSIEGATARRAAGARIDGIERALRQLADEARAASSNTGALESSVRVLARELQLAEARGAGRGALAPSPRRAAASGLERTINELQHDVFVHARALEQLKRHRFVCPQCGAEHVVAELIRLQSVGAPLGGGARPSVA